ncbi:MAG: flavodoxin, partial [Lachnospiraceae bacterium]
MKRISLAVTGLLVAALTAGCGSSSAAAAAETTAAAPKAAAAVSTQASSAAADSEEENYTRYADYTPERAVDAGITEGTSDHILVAYFSRSSNTSLAGTDAVSSASLAVTGEDTALGNAQQMAEWIADETGGSLYPIQTKYTYPVDYRQTVQVGEGQDEDGIRPELVNPIDLSSYDIIYLVYPIWHYTLPAPMVSFLDAEDLSGKTLCCFTTSAGSGFADTLEKIQEAEPDATVLEGITVSQDSIDGAEKDVREEAKTLLTEAEGTNSGKEQDMNNTQDSTIQVQVGGTSFSAELEDNDTAEAFRALLPLSLDMSELN